MAPKMDQAKKLTKVFSVVMERLAEQIVLGYGREDELAADAMAVDLLTREGVGYDPHALRDFISRLPKRERGAWATHPKLEGRIKAVEDAIAERGVTASVHKARTRRFKAMTVGLRGQ